MIDLKGGKGVQVVLGQTGAAAQKAGAVVEKALGKASFITAGGFKKQSEALMASFTQGPATAQTPVDFGYSDGVPLILAANEKIYAAISNSQTGIVFQAEGADY